MAKVLVVDDEPLFRDYLRKILEREGYEVVEAADGEDGVRKVNEHEIDLVITDIVMPKMDGIDFIMDLNKRRPNVGVIAVSGGGRPSGCFLIPAKALGAARTLSKPFSRGELINVVSEVLNEVTFN